MSLAGDVAHILRSARGDRSRRSLAEQMGVSPNTLRELEVGQANPTLLRLEQVAKGYGVELELFGQKLAFPPSERKKNRK